MTDIVPINASLPAHGVRPEIMSVCILSERWREYFSTASALAELNERGLLGQVPVAAANARRAMAPVSRDRLTDRLTALGMMKAPNRPPAEASIWLRETARLLADLPEDILATAIDELVVTIKFLPDVSEIRAKADPRMEERRRMVSQLEAMQRYLDSGQPIPKLRRPDPPKPREPDRPMTPAEVEEMNAIMSRIGASTRYRDDGSRFQVETGNGERKPSRPLRKPTRQDYIEMGVDPAILDKEYREESIA